MALVSLIMKQKRLLMKYLDLQKDSKKYQGIFLETAHPIKFSNSVEKIINTKIEIPKRLYSLLKKEKISSPIIDYRELKSFLHSI